MFREIRETRNEPHYNLSGFDPDKRIVPGKIAKDNEDGVSEFDPDKRIIVEK